MANFTPVGVEALVKGLGPYLKDLNKMDKKQQGLGKSAGNLGKQFTGLGKGILKVGALAATAAVTGIGVLAVATGALGIGAVRTAIKFESAFAGVIKTTDGLTDSAGKLNVVGEELRQGFVDLSKEVPLAFEELAAIGEIGGQLGIGKESLIDFTETVAALGVATNLSTQEAATGLARLSNIFGVSTEDMSGNIADLGNTLVALGNNFATTEAEILTFGERMAGAGSIAGFTQADVLGIGTAMSSVGIQAEAGGTAVQKVMLGINNAVNATTTGFVDNTDAIDKNINKLTSLNGRLVGLESKAGLTGDQILQMRDDFIAAGGSAEEFGRQLGATERRQLFDTAIAVQNLTMETQLLRDEQGKPIDAGQLQKFAKVAGKSAKEFETLWREDASAAFELFVEGLANEGDNAVNVLKDLELSDQRLIRAFLSLAGAGDTLGDAIELANNEFDDGNALQEEAQKRYATTESQLAILKNTFRAIGDAIGSRFLPFINRLVKAGKDLINKFAEPIERALEKKVIPAIEGVIALAGKFGKSFSKAFEVVKSLGAGGITAFFSGLEAGLIKIGIASPQLSEFFRVLRELINLIVGEFASAFGLIGDTVSENFSPMEFITNTVLPAVTTALQFVIDNFEAFKGVVLGVGAVLAGAAIAAVLTGIVTAIGAILSPIGLLIAAAALLGAAWSANWFGIREITAQVIEVIQGIIAGLVDTFTSTILPQFQAAFDNLTLALNQMGLDWGDVWNAIVEAIRIVGIAIGVVIGAVVVTIVGFVTGIATALAIATSFFEDFGAAFSRIIEGIATTFAGWVMIFEGIMAGDWIQVWEGAKLVVEGAILSIIGYFDLLLTAIDALVSTAIGFFAGFGLGVIEIFTNLSDTLIGNSIIPDMIQGIIEAFIGMIEPIASAFSGIVDIVSGIFSSLFGGGDEGGFSLDLTAFTDALPAAITTGRELFGQLTQAIEQVNIEIAEVLTETLVAFTALALELITQIHAAIMKVDLLIVKIYTVSLPTLQVVSITTTQIMVQGFTEVNIILQETLALLVQITSQLERVAEAITTVVEEGLKLKEVIRLWDDMIDRMERAVKVGNSLVGVMKAITAAKQGAAAVVSGRTGIGFQTGTGPLGFLIPSGFPNDTFPINVTSGERVLVAPPGRSIESIVSPRMVSGDTFNFSMTVNTMAAPQAVIQQFEVMRALVG